MKQLAIALLIAGSAWAQYSPPSGGGGSSPVTSVFSRVGVVTPQPGDYTAAQVTNAVDSTGSYSNPGWITAIANNKVTGLTGFATLGTGATTTYVRGDASTQTHNIASISDGSTLVLGAANISIAGCVAYRVSAGTLTCVSGFTWDGTNLNIPGGLNVTGAITTNAGGGVAGSFGLTQGTAVSAIANAITFTAPTSVTAYKLTFPSSISAGFLKFDGSGVGSYDGTTYLSNALASTHLFVGNGSNVATDVAMSGDCTLSNTGAVTCAKINSTTVPTNSAADQFLGTTASATGAWAAVPNCGDSSHALAYNTTTHAFSCQSVTGGASSPPTFPVNAQTATYQVLAADFTACKVVSVASGTFTVTLVASGSQPSSGQCIWVVNYGSGVVTIARSGQNINGGVSSLTLAAGSATAPTGAFVVSDGTNYFASTMGGSVGGANPAGSNSEYQYRSNGTTFAAVSNSGPVPTAGWTLQNCGTAAGRCWLENFSGTAVTFGQDYNASVNWGMASQVLSGTPPYTVIAQMVAGASAEVIGLALTDGTKFYDIDILQASNVSTIETRQSAGFTSGGSVAGATVHVAGGQVTFKVTDDGVHRTWSYWSNGAWVQQLQETTATFLTPTGVGPVLLNNNASNNLSSARITYWCVSAATTCNGQ